MLLEKLITNIVTNPTDAKYRTIKVSNATIQGKLLVVKEMQKLLLMLGYQPQNENFVLPD